MSTVSSRVNKKMCAIFCGVIIVNEMLCNCYLWKLPMASNLGLEDLDLDINQQATECSTLIGGAVTKGFGAAAPWRQQQYPPWHRIQARSSTPEWFVEKKSFWIDQYVYIPPTRLYLWLCLFLMHESAGTREPSACTATLPLTILNKKVRPISPVVN